MEILINFLVVLQTTLLIHFIIKLYKEDIR